MLTILPHFAARQNGRHGDSEQKTWPQAGLPVIILQKYLNYHRSLRTLSPFTFKEFRKDNFLENITVKSLGQKFL